MIDHLSDYSDSDSDAPIATYQQQCLAQAQKVQQKMAELVNPAKKQLVAAVQQEQAKGKGKGRSKGKDAKASSPAAQHIQPHRSCKRPADQHADAAKAKAQRAVSDGGEAA